MALRTATFPLPTAVYRNVTDHVHRGIRTTCQFTCKIFSKDASKPHLWSSSPLSNFEIAEDKVNFFADDCALELSEDGNTWTIKSMNDQKSIVNLKITKAAPGYQAGKTGTSSYGTDPENPWGWMRHAFWPRCTSDGTILTQEGPIDFKGQAFYVYALQGMKPHHAAARWNFANFQGPTYSAILMEFITPPSYGTTVVNVGGIAKDGEIVAAGCDNSVTHVAVKKDEDSGWDAPSEVKFVWNNKSKDGKVVEGTLQSVIGDRADRVDVMAEVPGFVKTLVATTAGTKPYVYQVCLKSCKSIRNWLLRKLIVPQQGYIEAQNRRRRNHRGGPAVHRSHFHLGPDHRVNCSHDIYTRFNLWTRKYFERPFYTVLDTHLIQNLALEMRGLVTRFFNNRFRKYLLLEYAAP